MTLLVARVGFAQVSGDELRGAGAYMNGLGWYNLNTAKATSINVDSVIRWKADLRKIQAERRLLQAKDKSDKKAKVEEIKQALLRREYELRTNPDASDVYKGDALDVLLYDLTDPSLSLGVWQASPVELPEGMSVKELIFQFTPLSAHSTTSSALGRGVIALSRLDIEGKWPTALRGEELKDERAAFEQAYKTVRDDVVAGKLDLRSLSQLDNSLDDLKGKVNEVLPAERGFRIEGIRFVEGLRSATRMFDATTVDYAKEILIDTQDHDAKTVGELVAFMSKYRLQFASAEKYPAQRELYAKLYQAMRTQTEKFGLVPDKDAAVPEDAWGSVAKAGRTWNG
ncbi:MAG TPA: hypothetical protein VL096_01915, partial [Pirellulaceae bacterium]|nr:hypothetical protein [Pirellulaceae bacterium]